MNEITKFLTETVSTVAATTIPIVILLYISIQRLFHTYLLDRDRARYSEERQMAMLSEMRASYEHRIADLSREMVATRARWEDANHLILSGQRNQSTEIGAGTIDVARFLKPYGIDPNSVSVDSDKIFVLTPFSEDELDIYSAIKSVCGRTGFTALRGDERRAEGDIFQHILEEIVTARIVIANISSRNPNVFYELGIAMAIGKPTLLISDTLEDTPFDLKSRRIVVYKGLKDLETRLSEALLQTIRNVPDIFK
jgi:hypothetical protein